MDLEKLKSIYTLRKSLSIEEYDTVKSILSTHEIKKLNELELSLSIEDEFILISKLLGRCVDIGKVDQSKYPQTKGIAPDIHAIFKKDYDTDIDDVSNQIELFIEIKRCYKKTWKISKNDFNQRLKYSNMHNKPLFYAIKFCLANIEYWTLYPANIIKMQNYKIKMIVQPGNHFDYIVGNCQVFTSNFLIEKHYVKEKFDDNATFSQKLNGYLSKCIIFDEEKEIELKFNDPFIWSLIYAFSMNEIPQKGKKLEVKQECYKQISSLYKIILFTIKGIHKYVIPDFSFDKYLHLISNGEEPQIDYHYGWYIVEKLVEYGIGGYFIEDHR